MAGEAKRIKPTGSGRIGASRGKSALIIIFVLMVAICVRFAYLQIFDPKEYKIQALDQYTNSVTIDAKRGAIYASDGTTELAVSATVYNCFISPYDIEDDDQLFEVADALSAILSVDRDEILKKGQKKNSKYQTIKKFISETEEMAIRAFVDEHVEYTRIINLEETTKRYYRYGSFAAQLLGFAGSDNQGLTGLELTYDEYLAGVDGKSVKAADAYGNELDSGVGSTYIPAVDGLNVVTTVDFTIQSIVEKYIKQAYEEHKPNGRVECIVMDVDNGELLASGIYPSFDLNNYSTLSAEYELKYEAFIGTDDERSEYRSELLNEMWNNTIATQTYEPGSTFKIITSAVALEEGTISYEHTSFNCRGAMNVAGTTIHCHKVIGHGTQSFKEALVNSCNPALIQIGTSIGTTRFKKYFDEFGYTKVTGSDIVGEVSSIYYGTTDAQFESLELAVYSFGQTFAVTPLQHIRAVSAVANGGYLVVPHAVKALSDSNGTIVQTFEYEKDRQVISTETCNKILETLTNSTKNASVSGYNIVSKTGTSEKRDTEREDDYVSSCVSFAPAENPRIAILVLVDEPTSGQHYGSAVAAPVVSNILSEVLPHLGIAPNTDSDDTFNVPEYTGKKVSDVKKQLEDKGIKCVVRGTGNTVNAQLPAKGTVISDNGVVILYTDGAEIDTNATVPDVEGMTPSEAIRKMLNNNLNVSIKGIFNNDFNNCKVISQSHTPGEKVLPGTVIEIEFLYEESIE